MTSTFNKYGSVVFSVVGALIILGAAWWAKGTENDDTWLYVFSVWMILFSAMEAYSSVAIAKISKLVLAALTGAFAIILGVWWANGAEQPWLFLTCVVALLVSFFAVVSRKK